jgi:hypothetical protein
MRSTAAPGRRAAARPGVGTSRLEEAAHLGEPAGVAAIEAVVEEVDAHELSAWAQPAVHPFQRCCRFGDVVKGTERDDDVKASLVGAQVATSPWW